MKVATPEEFVDALFILVPAVLSKKVIVLPATGEDNVAVSLTDWPGVIPPAGIAEPSVLVMAKVMDCELVFGLTRDGVVEIHTVELFEVAQLPVAGAINNTCLSAAFLTPSPEKFASIVWVPANCGTYV